jgi:hypothetical protein
LTLGGNVSIAAGPVGRNAEAAGAASLKGVAGIFSYSKTKGLFAGVSLEGSGIIERRDANEKLYGRRWTAKELLSGAVPPPSAAEPLLRVLNSRAFSGVGGAANVGNDSAMYNDIPVYDDSHDNVVWQGRRGSAMGEGVRRDRTGSMGTADDDYQYRDRPQRSQTPTRHSTAWRREIVPLPLVTTTRTAIAPSPHGQQHRSLCLVQKSRVWGPIRPLPSLPSMRINLVIWALRRAKSSQS